MVERWVLLLGLMWVSASVLWRATWWVPWSGLVWEKRPDNSMRGTEFQMLAERSLVLPWCCNRS